LILAVSALAGIFLLLDWSLLRFGGAKPIQRDVIKMPAGVNFGSWLSLEDYFFAGHGAVEVATPDDKNVAACLPPLHTGQGPRWQSETDLLANLTKQDGLAVALKVFHAHRVSFIDCEEDLAALAALGVKHVRVPMSWCLTDHDPSTIGSLKHTNTSQKSLAEKFTCADPFFEGVMWPAIPKELVAGFLRSCASHGITASLDIHTYPGATSIGTFSGLWPRWPRFWTHGDLPDQPKTDIGRGLLRDFISWMESLQETDPEAFEGLLAISPMNEPAHLAGLFGPGGVMPNKKSFLPDLPTQMAQDFLTDLNKFSDDSHTSIPDGPHLRVLLWLRDAVHAFRHSSLPAYGKELHVNVHESIFRPNVLPQNDSSDPGGRHPGATRILASWWRGITTADERSSWAVLDMHHYHAWEPSCQGASDGPPVGNYTCGDNLGRRDALERCSSWAKIYRDAVDSECGTGAKLASAEFSASTHHRVRHACNDLGTLRASYDAQIEAAEKSNVELFWWSYKMPYGGAFRPAWSFKHFMYLLGVTSHPDETAYDCGEHLALSNEPNDDTFFPYR
jgi:hypothetical protein